MKKQQLLLLIILCFGVKSFSQLQKLVSSQKDELVIKNTSDSYLSSRKNVSGILYEDFAGKAKVMTMEKDAPALPTYSKSLELSNKGKISIVISYDSFEEFENVNILPSKGSLKRNVNPDLIPYVFGEKYSKNSFYPGNLAVLGDPFIFRNTRGVTISFNPYQYNPVTKKLRVYKNITVKVITNKKEVGVNEIEASNNENNSTFPELYKNLYINALVANPVRDKGEMLIIAPVAYSTTLQSFIDWKIEKGIKTTLATLTQTGSTAASIKTYVQNFFAANPNLVYVQLVGDHENLPSYSYGTSSDNETLWSDSFYGQLAGTDLFPEVMVGRFSGSTTDVKTMIDRVLEYETNPLAGDWMTKAIGIASNEGAGQGDDGEADYVHMRNIRTKFMSFGYTSVHEFYQGSQGGTDASGDPTAAIISPAINQGVGILNYTGHGDLNSMVTGNYTINNVNTLTNSGKYPFVISVACNNGTFVGGTSLCEAFTRVKYNNTPAGAIASCGSSILMAWAEPMQTQDEMTELIIRSDSQNIRTTLGGLFYNGQVSMLETYNQNDSSKEVMETWVFFGDPSTEFRSKVTTNITATHPATISTAGGNLLIQSNTNGATVSITQNNIIIAKSVIVSGSATVLIPALTSTNSLKVTLSKDNAKPYRGTITVTTLGLPEYDSRFVIYPNPTSDFINIENTKNNITNAKIQLIDLNGRVIFSEDNVNLISKYSIPVSSLATGLYILDINDGGNRKTQKIQIR